MLTHRRSIDLPAQVSAGVEVLQADLRDREQLVKVVTSWAPDGDCHLAAVARIRESFTDPLGYFDINLGGTLNLLHALAEQSSTTDQPARLVFASAGAIYGPAPAEVQPVAEDQPPAPDSPYAASKLAAEHSSVPRRRSLC